MKEKSPEISSGGSAPEGRAASYRIPRATYRLQFGSSFTFRDAEGLIPYLDDLGISDVYASPLLWTCHDESHGYDICAHDQLNPAIGSEEEFYGFSAALKRAGMGLILDVVPNHMGISGARNRWWMDVLENGPSSSFSGYFDIDWQPAKPELKNKVLLPILEDQYGRVLEEGKFQLKFEEGAFFIYYYEHKLPIAPRTYSKILEHPLQELIRTLGKEHEDLQELQSILTALSYLPPQTESAPEKLEERKREKEVIKRRIASLCQKNPEVGTALEAAIQAFNGWVGDPRSFDPMDSLINAQAYRPAFWRVAADEINYRRFFDINQLAAIRMEFPHIFQEAHDLIFRLLDEGKITGLRIDHPDGLWNPARYFEQLQQIFAGWIRESRRETLMETAEAGEGFASSEKEKGAGGDPGGFDDRPLYVVVEKILCEGEELPRDWPIYGSTGYDFLNLVNGLFINPRNERAFDRLYSHFIGTSIHFGNLVNSSKKMIMLVSLSSEILALAHSLERIIETCRRYRDFTLNSLTFVLREIIACLPVYRTYINETRNVSPRDRLSIETAVEEAKRRNPRTAEAIFDFIRDTLLLRSLSDFAEEDQARLVQFVMKFQQITGPVMAKGMEDTAFYVYNRLTSLNEVGGHPECFGMTTDEFHKKNRERLESWPCSLLATSTHDTKRGEDVRARIDVLSEIPGEWRAAVSRWSRWNAPKRTMVDGRPAPDRNDEYLLYQTLVGAWPIERPGDPLAFDSEEFSGFRERIAAYMRKATLEAKVHTSWVNPNEEYDEAVKDFVLKLLEPRGKNRFLSDLQEFQRRVAFFGRWNSLSQVLLKLTCPGVPDIYQGTELWDLSLVDPDNRRPVDYPKRRTMLAELKERVDSSRGDLVALSRELLENAWDGRIKLHLICRALDFRRANPELFTSGTYHPVEALGEKRDHVIAFARRDAGKEVLVAVPRLVAGLTAGKEMAPVGAEIWGDTLLFPHIQAAPRVYQNIFSGERLSVKKVEKGTGIGLAEAFSSFPVAFLEAVGE